MTRILTALCLFLGLAIPAQASCQCRIASPSITSDWLYLVGYNGDKIEWNGATLTIPAGWATKVSNAGLSPSTLYYVYVRPEGTAPALELSTAGHSTNAAGEEIKQGDSTRLLVGMVYTDPAGKFWRDAQHALILNWWNRLPIFVAPPAAGITTTSTTWDELGYESINDAHILTWGYQLGVANNVDMGISGIASNDTGGGRVDVEFGTVALGPDAPVSSWISMTSTAAGQWQNVSGTSTMGLPEGYHVITFWGRAPNGGTATIYVNTFASTNG